MVSPLRDKGLQLVVMFLGDFLGLIQFFYPISRPQASGYIVAHGFYVHLKALPSTEYSPCRPSVVPLRSVHPLPPGIARCSDFGHKFEGQAAPASLSGTPHTPSPHSHGFNMEQRFCKTVQGNSQNVLAAFLQ